MPKRVRLALATTLAVATAIVAGCGGEDRLSTEEFQQRANAVCAKYNDKIAALGNPSSPEEIPEFVKKGIPLIEQGLAELRSLNPPEEFESDYDRMLDETAKAIPAARQLADAAEKRDAAAVQEALQAGQRAGAASDEIATKLGLDQCAQG
jgi:hypothetical protein